MKVDAVKSKTDDDKFEENMKSLEEEHRYQLQHQAEMMCQVLMSHHEIHLHGLINPVD